MTTIILFITWLASLFGNEFIQSQGPVDVAVSDNETSEPEPDVVVLEQTATAYSERNPSPADLRLVVEVSDTTLRFDLSTKAALYARAGIVDYWVVDVTGRQIFVHRQPTPNGYTEIIAYSVDEEIATLARPDAPARVIALLPPV